MTGMNVGPWAGGFGAGPGSSVPELQGSLDFGTGRSLQPSAGPGQSSGSNLQTAGMVMMAVGAINNAISGFYAAQSQRYQLKSQASALKFQSSLSQLNARRAEVEADSIMEAGHRQIGQYTMRAGAAQASQRASFAARGIDKDVGSAAEHLASMEYAKQSDVLTINANAVRAAESARMQAQNYQTQSLMQGVQAQNLMASRRTINPATQAAGSLLGDAGSLAYMWSRYS